ncbi:Crp/Fnr family transcriptional regulator [Neolewinella agarilytica]|uniref:cAMP-binding domain of CRP or a regulatory subunit of cAMP-dependent protein kinases n=1 Tax=Neolewinella agarilytica TaxID=478744 RepID=A0A1H9KKJ2_9BACT|nr:Crp/Fnr family transcriptional regulator [Neolewinella agarilytica]SEQ99589.1 cAMP-binding domain of CRP or a regulatory subunit of cAMP-dependent protein kinases [Neolewinella agarilytica]
MPYNLLRENINSYLPLSDQDLSTISDFFTFREIKKKDFLLRGGKTCRFEGFVLGGCFRVFTLDQKGNEINLYFAVSGWWLMDIDSFMNQTPSDLYIQALEDSQVLLISKENKRKLYNSLPIVEKLFRIIFQKALVSWQRRLIRNHSMTAKERYFHFMDTYPDISARLSNKHLASYLGISHEFLSRIKNSNKVR